MVIMIEELVGFAHNRPERVPTIEDAH